MLWLLAIFLLGWIYATVHLVPNSVAVAFGIPLVITIVTTTVDEVAEYGVHSRPRVAILKFLANLQWALMIFYFSIVRHVFFATSPSGAADQAFLPAIISIAFGLIASVASRKATMSLLPAGSATTSVTRSKAQWVTFSLAVISLSFVVYFGANFH
jgi:hypothetical protein